jgi:hypothetical protein
MCETLVTEFFADGRWSLSPERVLLYVVPAGEFLELSGEAYVRNVTPMFSVPPGLAVTYACFRDLEGLRNSWEFCAGFYLWEEQEL